MDVQNTRLSNLCQQTVSKHQFKKEEQKLHWK